MAKKILIAEDEEVLRMLITDTLEEEGYDIDEACDGEEAYQLIEENEYDLVILDYMMPQMTGLEVIEKIREHEDDSKKNVNILMLSAKSQKLDQDRVMTAGADHFISKPFSPLALIEKIGDILDE
ncbi:histidine kinase [Mesobacillus campisalis]|uniref:Histidine kinase n=1 Tax=Mesobacillus campisalis TaxID=1408103 RepID=A0A0M2SUP8_9BACI|nr:response regulator [Mesobacillus campisalis]KKK36722.1 histidine kinase [Mesobacillus campisalis]